jgi:hypothetical protein
MAVIEWDPDESVDVVKVDWPLPFSEPVPSVVPLSVNVTEPVGMPAVDVTVAVKVTARLKAEGFTEEVTVVVVDASATFTTWVKGVEMPPL